MSQVVTLPDVLSVDPRLAGISASKSVEIRRGAANLTTTRTTASSVSNGQLVFNPTLNGPQSTIIDPYMYIEVPITVTVSATGGVTGVDTYLQDNFALRQYPLASVTYSSLLQLNNQQMSFNPSQCIHQLSLFQNFAGGDNEASVQSAVPIMYDQFPAYSEGVGSLKSPLLSYESGGTQYYEPRGSFNSLFTTVTGTTGTWQFTYTIREPVIHPALSYKFDDDSREGLPFINQFQLTLQLVSNLSRMFSLDAVTCPNITGIDVQIGSTAALIQTWLTKPASMIMPPVNIRSFNTVIFNQTTQSAFTSGQQQTIQSQSYSVNQIPKKIWVWVCDGATDVTNGYTKSDFNFSIEQVSVLFNNRSNLLANMNSLDLYNNFMVGEGSKVSYVQSKQYVGAVLAIDPTALGLLNDEAPGVFQTTNLQIQVQCTNIAATTVTNPVLCVAWANETILTIDKNSVANTPQGFITSEDVIRAAGLPANPSQFREANIYGGSFWNKVKDFGKKAYSGVIKPALKNIKDQQLISKALAANPETMEFAPIAQNFGFGRANNAQMRAARRGLRLM